MNHKTLLFWFNISVTSGLLLLKKYRTIKNEMMLDIRGENLEIKYINTTLMRNKDIAASMFINSSLYIHLLDI